MVVKAALRKLLIFKLSVSLLIGIILQTDSISGNFMGKRSCNIAFILIFVFFIAVYREAS